MTRRDETFVATRLLIAREQFFTEIDELINRIDTLGGLGPDAPAFVAWKKSVQSLLNYAFGEKSRQAYDFGWISFLPSHYGDDDDDYDWVTGRRRPRRDEYRDGLNEARVQLQVIRNDVEKFIPSESMKVVSNSGEKSSIGKDVFVVHGHDETLLYKVKDFLKTLDLTPVVLREQPNEGKTIIEKFETTASDVGFAIVLLTADDVGRAKEEEVLKDRARQNVVFELGYFTGKFGRSHIAVLCDKSVENPGDIAGVVYTPIDESGAWMLNIARDLRKAGLEVDLNKIA